MIISNTMMRDFPLIFRQRSYYSDNIIYTGIIPTNVHRCLGNYIVVAFNEKTTISSEETVLGTMLTDPEPSGCLDDNMTDCIIADTKTNQGVYLKMLSSSFESTPGNLCAYLKGEEPPIMVEYDKNRPEQPNRPKTMIERLMASSLVHYYMAKRFIIKKDRSEDVLVFAPAGKSIDFKLVHLSTWLIDR